jgi:hypothetical protein
MLHWLDLDQWQEDGSIMAHEPTKKIAVEKLGQERVLRIRHQTSGEVRTITQQQWREDGANLRDAGFERVTEGYDTGD